MKENDKEEEESDNSSNKMLFEKTKTSRNILNRRNFKTIKRIKNSSLNNESELSFDKMLLKKIHKEEKELKIQMQLKERNKLIKQLYTSSTKDYIVFFIYLISSSFNYNYSFLPFIGIGMIYLLCIENLNRRIMKLKYLLEIFTIGYACYLLLFKVIIFFLIKNEEEIVLADYKGLLLDFGCCFLKDLSSDIYLILNFVTELIVIAISAYAILISFRSRLLTPSVMDIKNITNVKLSKYILIIYFLIVASTMFNLSYLSLFYIICIQIILLLNSMKISENKIKILFKIVIYILMFLIICQIILINVFNIPSFQEKYQYLYQENNNNNYYTWVQIGINVNSSVEIEDIITKFCGYFFSILTLMVLRKTLNKLNSELHNQTKSDMSSNNNKNRYISFSDNKNYGIFTKIINNIMQFLYHPVFNFEASRVLAIFWTYFYRNLFSFGILIFIFISFFTVHTKRNKFLVIFILSPMLILSLACAHISNIKGILEGLTDMEKKGHSRNGFGKYDYIYFEYVIGHIFYIIVMFLINSIYTAELSPKNIEKKRKKEKKPQQIEMKILSKIDKLSEAILPEDNTESTNPIEDNKKDSKSDLLETNDRKRYIVDDYGENKDINAEPKKGYIIMMVLFLFFL